MVSAKVFVPVLAVLGLFVAAGIYGSTLNSRTSQTSSTNSSSGSTSAASSSPASSTMFTTPSSCHSVNGLPDSACTPGAINANVTQANIQSTICVAGYTASIRPPTSYTNALKSQSIQLYGYADTNLADYEEDHLISLEIGGNPTAVQNLWAEPHNVTWSSYVKDGFENHLHSQVCSGAMTLAEAQHEIATNWVYYYSLWKGSSTPTTTNSSTTSVTIEGLNVSISVARDPIQSGSVENITVNVNGPDGAVEGVGVHIHVTYASQSTSKDYDCTTSLAGSCHYSWTIGSNSDPGTFEVTVTVEGHQYSSSFQVIT